MKTNKTKLFINHILNENFVEAKQIISDRLNKKLGTLLEEKFNSYASTIFEKWDAKKADKNKDGEISDWEKASTEWAETGEEGEDTENDETTDEESDEEEEEDESEDEEDEEDSKESEEDDEEGEDEEEEEYTR
jgi:hypothetical protein